MKFIIVLKGGLSQRALDQIGALPSDKVGKYNLYQGQGEFYITKHKLDDNLALMETADTFEKIMDIYYDNYDGNYFLIDKELKNEYEDYLGMSIMLDPDLQGDNLENYGLYDLSSHYAD